MASHARTFADDEDKFAGGVCNCCCSVSLCVLVLLLLALGVALFFILVMKPTRPEFDLQSATIENFQVDSQIVGASNVAVYLSMNIVLIFSASNPNKVGIEYEATQFNCLYKTTLLGVANVPPFTQPAHSHITLRAVVVVDRLNVLQAASADLLRDATLNDKVVLTINGPIDARVRVLGIKSPKVQVYVNCQIAVRPQERQVESKVCNVGQVSLSN